ncbi:MAG TPA: RidA family protein [Pseudolabrys sp.]|nr:RidA family protein [Pseudolabrys sp.]
MCGSTSGVYPNSSGARHLLRSILMVTRKRKSAKAGSGKQAFERHHFNYGRWTKSRFSEAVTVTGPAKMIFLAGIGSEHEQTGKIMHPGDFTAQCRYAYRKLKKVLARNGATMADVVKQVTYVIDARHQQLAGKCRLRAYGKAPLPAHTFVNVSQLAWPAMLVEIDVIALVPQRAL